MKDRIQKIIASRGVTSRRKAEEMITAGRVTCNGRVCLLGESADPDIDMILLDGKPLLSGGEYTYIMLHKPRGFVPGRCQQLLKRLGTKSHEGELVLE